MENDVATESSAVQDSTLTSIQAEMAELEKQMDSAQSSEAEQSAESGAVSETAEPNQESEQAEAPKPSRKDRSAERRIRQLNEELKTARAELEKARSAGTRPVSESKETAKSSAPKFKEYAAKIGTTYPDWDTAHDAWEEAQSAFYAQERTNAVKDAIESERKAKEQAEQQAKAQKETEKQGKAFADKATEFRKTLKTDTFSQTFQEVVDTINDALPERPELSELSQALLEAGPEIVHYLGEHHDELDALVDMPLRRALIKIGQLEASDKIKTPTPRTRTAARRIGENIGGKHPSDGTSTMDVVERGGSMDEFMKARAAEMKR